MIRFVSALLLLPAFTVLAQASGPAALVHLSTNVEVRLRNGILSYTVSEMLRNPGGWNAEADYTFPLPRNGVFQDLTMSFKGEMIGGRIFPAPQAGAIYSAIVRTNRDPALVEWAGPRQLRTRIFPITPGETRQVDVRMQAVAALEGSAIRVEYFQGSERGRPPAGNTTPVTLTLIYPDSATYGEPYSTTHVLSAVGRRDGVRTYSVSGPSAHVALILPVDGAAPSLPQSVSHAAPGLDGFTAFQITPPELPPPAAGRDIVLALDVSGSMAGARLDRAREIAKRILGALGERDRFRIISFSGQTGFLDPDPLPATTANVRQAVAFIDSLTAGGGTDLLSAIREAFHAPARTAERESSVILVTDGDHTLSMLQTDSVVARLSAIRGRSHIYMFDLSDVQSGLASALDDRKWATVHHVQEKRQVNIAAAGVARAIAQPAIRNLRVTSGGARIEQFMGLENAELLAGAGTVVLARYPRPGQATLRFEGFTVDGPVSWSAMVELPAAEPQNSALTRIWAAAQATQLALRREQAGNNTQLDAELASLGERFSIVTPLTSFLVLEPGIEVTSDGRVLNARLFMQAQTGPGGAGSGGVAERAIQGRERDVVIQLRNPINLAGYTQPMIIIDGVMYLQDSPALRLPAAKNPLGLTGDEIESIEIVRGSAAAAMYGRAAANGVINIRTKGGRGVGLLSVTRIAYRSWTNEVPDSALFRARMDSVLYGRSTSNALDSLRTVLDHAAGAVLLNQRPGNAITLDEVLRRQTFASNRVPPFSWRTARRASGRVFRYSRGAWTDAQHSSRLQVITVKRGSPAHSALMNALPELDEAAHLGERVVVAGRALSICFDGRGISGFNDEAWDSVLRRFR